MSSAVNNWLYNVSPLQRSLQRISALIVSLSQSQQTILEKDLKEGKQTHRDT